MVTTYAGAEADAIRPNLVSANREELAKSYLNYLTRQYPHARGKGPVAWEDYFPSGKSSPCAEYAIDRLWDLDDNGRLACSFPAENRPFNRSPRAIP